MRRAMATYAMHAKKWKRTTTAMPLKPLPNDVMTIAFLPSEVCLQAAKGSSPKESCQVNKAKMGSVWPYHPVRHSLLFL